MVDIDAPRRPSGLRALCRTDVIDKLMDADPTAGVRIKGYQPEMRFATPGQTPPDSGPAISPNVFRSASRRGAGRAVCRPAATATATVSSSTAVFRPRLTAQHHSTAGALRGPGHRPRSASRSADRPTSITSAPFTPAAWGARCL